MDTVAGFPNLPSGYVERLQRILSCPGSTVQELIKTVNDLQQAWCAVVSLPGVQYKPRFQV